MGVLLSRCFVLVWSTFGCVNTGPVVMLVMVLLPSVWKSLDTNYARHFRGQLS